MNICDFLTPKYVHLLLDKFHQLIWSLDSYVHRCPDGRPQYANRFTSMEPPSAEEPSTKLNEQIEGANDRLLNASAASPFRLLTQTPSWTLQRCRGYTELIPPKSLLITPRAATTAQIETLLIILVHIDSPNINTPRVWTAALASVFIADAAAAVVNAIQHSFFEVYEYSMSASIEFTKR